MRGYDVIVIGLGGMGSAIAAHLAKRGKRVLGLEQFELGHELGASAGRTRIIRKAYFESPAYVPLLERAYELWRDLEAETGTTLLDLPGILMVGAANSTVLSGVRVSMARHGVPVDELSRSAAARRFPQARFRPNEYCLFEPDAGIVFPERGIAAHQNVARAHGAELRGATAVAGWHRNAVGTVEVELASGDLARADRLVLSAGPWLAELARDIDLPLTIQRNVQIWFAPSTRAFSRSAFPAFFVDRPEFPKPLYGFPDLGDGVKAALHAYGPETRPSNLDREIHPSDIAAVKDALDGWLPGAAETFRFGKACMYALTPDEHFILDRHPHDAGIVIAGGFSGHGYKFCPVVGEIVADLVDGAPRRDIEFLGLRRFSPS